MTIGTLESPRVIVSRVGELFAMRLEAGGAFWDTVEDLSEQQLAVIALMLGFALHDAGAKRLDHLRVLPPPEMDVACATDLAQRIAQAALQGFKQAQDQA